MSLSRMRLLGRLASRNALRHKGQTVRAVGGLLVTTVILTAGLGLGESGFASFSEAALARFGDVDLTLRGTEPFPVEVGEALPTRARLSNVAGAAALELPVAASNPAAGLAEPLATLRGVSPSEAAAFGSMILVSGGAAPEPRAGEVVLTRDLARVLDAHVGDLIVLRTQRLADAHVQLETFNATGVAGLPTRPAEEHAFVVRSDAAGIGAEVRWTGHTGLVRATLRAPSGIEHANESATAPVSLRIPGPVEKGTWILAIAAATPTPYVATGGAAYLPPAQRAETATIEARVAAIVEPAGRAGVTGRPTAILPLGVVQEAVGARGLANVAHYAVEGNARQAAAALAAAIPAEDRQRLRIEAERLDALNEAAEQGAAVGAVVIAMGSFTILSAMLLAFTLFGAIVEERRVEIGVSRALGLTRGEITLALVMEGAMYAIAAAAAGLLLGLGILWLGVRVAGETAFVGGASAPSFKLQVSPVTMLIALLVGTLLPLATIAMASRRFARVDPARAIRGDPDDPKTMRRSGLTGAAGLCILGALLLVPADGRLLGVPLILIGLAVGLSALRRTLLATSATVGAIAYLVWSLYRATFLLEEADAPVTFLRGALLVGALAALAVASARPYHALLANGSRRLTSGMALSGFVGVRYLVARRRPVALTMSMIGLVALVVTVTGMLSAAATVSLAEDEGGYQILGGSAVPRANLPSPLPADLAASVERVDLVPSHDEFTPVTFQRAGQVIEVGNDLRGIVGATPAFAEANRYELQSGLGARAGAYASDRDAWDAVAAGTAMIVPWWALDGDRLRLGETVTLRTVVNGGKDYVIAGAIQSDFSSGRIFVAADDVREMGFPQATIVLVRAAPGADADALAHRLADAYAEEGLVFLSVREEIARTRQSFEAAVLVIEAFLATGLFVGLTATGFLASRAVRERLREIGTLRALGYERRAVARIFLIESLVTAGMGLAVGILAGLVVGHSLWQRLLRDAGVEFDIPWLLLALMATAVMAIAGFAARGPARRAANLPPAMAVRHVE